MPREPDEPTPSSESPTQQEQLRRLEAALSEGRARQEAVLEAWVRKMGRLPTPKERQSFEQQWLREAKQEAQRVEREAKRREREQAQRLEKSARRVAREQSEQLERQERHAARLEAKRKKREEREENRSPVMGVALMVVAVACLGMAIRLPGQFWWLIFVAVGFFTRAARHLRAPSTSPDAAREPLPSRTQSSDALPTPPPKLPEPVDPRLTRVDTVCDKLLTELRAAPEVLKEVVHDPERTVQALRDGCHALVRRERDLRALITPEESRRLEAEREQLVTRMSAEGDAVVRERLRGALAALDEQRQQRAELVTAADRLEAEHTRLGYTLENLYAQVLRVRSADSASADVAGAGLRHSVEQLGAEVDAVTQALEEVHGAPMAPDGRVRTR